MDKRTGSHDGTATGRLIRKLLIGLAAGFALFHLPAEALGQVVFDNATAYEGRSSEYSFSHTVNVGSDRILIVGANVESSSRYTDRVEFNSVNLTKITSLLGEGGIDCETSMWYMLDPPEGTFNVTVHTQASKDLAGIAMSFFGVDPTSPLGDSAKVGDVSNSTSVNVASASGDMVADVVCQGDSSLGSITVGADQTLRGEATESSNGDFRAAGSTEPGNGGTVTMSWTFTGGPTHAQIAVVLKASSVAAGTPSLSSAANQTFVVGNPATTAETVTIIDDASSPTITAANDIRIRIPSGFNMMWDNSVTSVTLGGNAASKVNATLLAYEDGDSTAVLNVTGNFATSDTVTIDGLKFTSFSAVSTADNLELEVNNDDAVSAEDDKTIEIVAETFAVAVTPDTTTASRLPSNGTNYTVDFTVTNNGNGFEDYDLLTTQIPGTAITVVSMTGTGVTQDADPDSARVSNLAATDAVIVTVTYSVADVVTGTADTLFFLARSVANPATTDDGRLELTVVRPNLTAGKAVSPGGTQLPGADLTYTVTITNDGTYDAAGVVVLDSIAAELDFKVGSVVNSLPVTATVEYSNDAGSTWIYVPVSAACGAPTNYDRCVTHIRWTLDNDLSYIGPNNTGDVEFLARIQ